MKSQGPFAAVSTKNTPKWGNFSWCGGKDDYRTLAELEGVNVVNLYTGINDEDEDHE